MKRLAFLMSVNPDQIGEYTSRHGPIWPELETVLRSHGAHNYSIFHDPATNTLFAYVEIEDEARWNDVAKTEICQKWWQHMKDIMPANPDGSPVNRPLNEVFHLS